MELLKELKELVAVKNVKFSHGRAAIVFSSARFLLTTIRVLEVEHSMFGKLSHDLTVPKKHLVRYFWQIKKKSFTFWKKTER